MIVRGRVDGARLTMKPARYVPIAQTPVRCPTPLRTVIRRAWVALVLAIGGCGTIAEAPADLSAATACDAGCYDVALSGPAACGMAPVSVSGVPTSTDCAAFAAAVADNWTCTQRPLGGHPNVDCNRAPSGEITSVDVYCDYTCTATCAVTFR